jgi:hypothetical protein
VTRSDSLLDFWGKPAVAHTLPLKRLENAELRRLYALAHVGDKQARATLHHRALTLLALYLDDD